MEVRDGEFALVLKARLKHWVGENQDKRFPRRGLEVLAGTWLGPRRGVGLGGCGVYGGASAGLQSSELWEDSSHCLVSFILRIHLLAFASLELPRKLMSTEESSGLR